MVAKWEGGQSLPAEERGVMFAISNARTARTD